MTLVIANGLIVKEGVYLYDDLVLDNPVIPSGMSIYSYESIDANGAYVGLKGYIGSDVTFDKLIPIFNTSTAKLLKSVTMSVDNVYVYTVIAGDISALGANIIVGQVIVNNQLFPASIVYGAYPLSAGNTITITGLPNMADVSSLKFLLQ